MNTVLSITKNSILAAIKNIEDNPILINGRESTDYDLVFEKKNYPPILILSEANKFLGGEQLTIRDFHNSTSTAFKILRDHGFLVERKSSKNFGLIKIWIEKTKVTGRPDRIDGERALGKVLWSPQRGKPNRRTGTSADIYKNMRIVNPGDIVLHLVDDQKISGISLVKNKVIETTGLKGTDWEGPAYLIDLENYIELTPSIDRTSLLNNEKKSMLLNIKEESEVFYNVALNLREGAYLTPCPVKLLYVINELYKTLSNKSLPFMEKINFEQQSQDVITQSLSKIPMKSLNYFLSIKTKPFIILAGLSGTGKSRLVRTLAYQFNNIEADKTAEKNTPTNFQLIKVKPNWHDSSELLGYESRISGKDRLIATDFIRFIVKAWQYPDTPFFLCLDEMNLAPVEQYFAEYLSAVETRRVIDGKIKTDALISGKLITKYANKADGIDAAYELWNELELTDTRIQDELKATGLGLPSNLIVMGTVNMDETTHSFSRKVLDRAMTIEMNDINLSEGLGVDTDDWSYPAEPLQKELVLSEKTQGTEVFAELSTTGTEIITYLDLINTKLEGSPFKIAYRVRDEFLLYAFNYSLLETKPEDWMKNVLDEMTLMKILPRIEGDEEKTKCLIELITLFESNNFKKSLRKANEMEERRKLFHYTSFWS
jgi:ABC-type transport system involved in cytochrome c biogenesis ATPase subunit